MRMEGSPWALKRNNREIALYEKLMTDANEDTYRVGGIDQLFELARCGKILPLEVSYEIAARIMEHVRDIFGFERFLW